MSNILPHERVWLKNHLDMGLLENQRASDDMNEAIESGNQWHDNAQYDEVVDRMKLIDNRYAPLAAAYRERNVVPYPDADSAEVKLGSLLRIKDDFATFDGLLVGMAKIGEEQYLAYYEADPNMDLDLEIVGSESPMGEAVIGKHAGDDVVWEVAGRTLTAEIVTVDNAWLEQHVGSIAVADTSEIEEK